MGPTLEVADVFRRHGEAFRQARAGHLGCVERRVMGAITACRTAVLGGHVEQCDDCGATRSGVYGRESKITDFTDMTDRLSLPAGTPPPHITGKSCAL